MPLISKASVVQTHMYVQVFLIFTFLSSAPLLFIAFVMCTRDYMSLSPTYRYTIIVVAVCMDT